MNRTILQTLTYLGAAINEGQPLKGVKKGPDIIRHSGLFQTLQNVYKVKAINDHGDIDFKSIPQQYKKRAPIKHLVNNLHVLDPILRTLSQKLYNLHKDSVQNNVILTVGGDHSIGSATINAAHSVYKNLKVIWVDAHPDFVNPYLKGHPNQNYHGMPLSHITGVHTLPGFQWIKEKLPFENVVMIGVRDIDQDQYVSIKKHNVKVFSMEQVTKYGIGQVMTRAIQYLDPKGDCPFHISFDLDAVDPYIVSQTGTVYRNGLSHRQACHIVRRVVNQRLLVSMDVVEINTENGKSNLRPKFRDEQHYKDISQSVGMAVDLVTSLCSRSLTF